MQGEVIKIGRWARDEEFAVHPIGSKPKRTLICPQHPPDPTQIPGHSYLFKTISDWRVQQVWSEFIAYEFGALLGLEVPRCFIAHDEETDEFGALIEFFFGYPGEPVTPRLIHGTDILNIFGKERTADRPHSVRTNMRLCRLLGIEDTTAWWGQLLAFDALIGNTDRHPENWGFLSATSAQREISVVMAPIYDNGTSLGYEVAEKKLAALRDASLEAYVARGTHHFGWEDADGGSIAHVDLCKRLVKAHPEALAAMRSAIQLTDGQVETVLNQCTTIAVQPRFTMERADFVARLVKARRASLKAALGDDDAKVA